MVCSAPTVVFREEHAASGKEQELQLGAGAVACSEVGGQKSWRGQ